MKGEYVFVPAGQTFANHYGNFGKALAAAGIISDEDASLRAHNGTYSHQELIDTALRCAVDLRRRPTIDFYERWRRQRRRELVEAGEPPKIASSALIHIRLGDRNWKQAMDEALGPDDKRLRERLDSSGQRKAA